MRGDVTFAMQQFQLSERQACKLVDLDRSSYRYEPRSDHNAKLRQEMVELARHRPRYGYRRLHALLTRRGHSASVQRVYRIYKQEGLAVWRLKRKRLTGRAAVVACRSGMGAGFRLRYARQRTRHSSARRGGCLHTGMPDPGSRH